jgi:hypothetical protein
MRQSPRDITKVRDSLIGRKEIGIAGSDRGSEWWDFFCFHWRSCLGFLLPLNLGEVKNHWWMLIVPRVRAAKTPLRRPHMEWRKPYSATSPLSSIRFFMVLCAHQCTAGDLVSPPFATRQAQRSLRIELMLVEGDI